MLKTENIDFAIFETLRVHPDFFPTMTATLLNQIKNGIELNKFTNTNDARKNILDMTSSDLLKYILKEAIKIYNASIHFYYNSPKMKEIKEKNKKNAYFMSNFPHFKELGKIIKKMSNPEINSYLYFQSNQNDLFALINIVLNIRWKKEKWKSYFEKFANCNSPIYGSKPINLFEKIDRDIENTQDIELIDVNFKTVNNCLGDLMSGVQLKNQRNEYALDGELFVTQDIGNVKPTQQDAAIILKHPENEELKFMAVADGMGKEGDKASSFLLQELSKWFISLPKDINQYPLEWQKAWNQKISAISDQIYKKYNEDYKGIIAGSTFTGALISKENTIISSVGDSRAYLVHNQELELITRDETEIWPSYVSVNDLEKNKLDDMRFEKIGQEVTRCIGDSTCENMQTYLIPTNSYRKLIFLTDGITKLVDQEKIKYLSIKTPPRIITQCLVNESLIYNAYRPKGTDKLHNGVLGAGQDNATAVSYVRR